MRWRRMPYAREETRRRNSPEVPGMPPSIPIALSTSSSSSPPPSPPSRDGGGGGRDEAAATTALRCETARRGSGGGRERRDEVRFPASAVVAAGTGAWCGGGERDGKQAAISTFFPGSVEQWRWENRERERGKKKLGVKSGEEKSGTWTRQLVADLSTAVGNRSSWVRHASQSGSVGRPRAVSRFGPAFFVGGEMG